MPRHDFRSIIVLTLASATLAPLPLPVRAEEPIPSLTLDYDVFTKESIVEIGGKKFRKVEYKSQVVYLQLLAGETNGSDLAVICEREGSANTNMKTPALIQGTVKITKRSRLFVEGLKQICVDQQGGKKIEISSAVQVGFLWDDSDDPKRILKNKRLFVNPFGGAALGFAAEW